MENEKNQLVENDKTQSKRRTWIIVALISAIVLFLIATVVLYTVFFVEDCPVGEWNCSNPAVTKYRDEGSLPWLPCKTCSGQ